MSQALALRIINESKRLLKDQVLQQEKKREGKRKKKTEEEEEEEEERRRRTKKRGEGGAEDMEPARKKRAYVCSQIRFPLLFTLVASHILPLPLLLFPPPPLHCFLFSSYKADELREEALRMTSGLA